MTNMERRDRQLLYISDDAVFAEQKKCRRLLQKLNFMDRSDFEGIAAVVKELFGSSDGAFLNPPFYCDYGSHIHVGKNFFANYNCTIIDVAPVTIGDNCQMAPNVAIYTAGHPVHPAARNTAYEYGIGVTIGHNVWIGGNSVILPGVQIGDNTVIGAGSVVTRDIPAWSVAAGNPCHVVRAITEADRNTYFRGIPADAEAQRHMARLWAQSDDPIKYPTAPDA
ncbi:MAG: sugar O-acetyltransferase [Oscillospiraceae bacterium]|nr:sugar O-acetyltransferase [Oscillospiraceae bacterium]